MATWNELSNEISQAVQEIGRSIVTVQGSGRRTSSGIILDENTVVTAAHTINEDGPIRVWISPEQPITVSLRGRDSSTDIAVLSSQEKITEVDMRPPDFAESPHLAVGHFVVAVARTWRGNIVASSGILSGLMGEWTTFRGKKIEAFVRPDLLLYRGFSGGALVGADRKIIGMMTPFVRRGAPLAIPYATIKRITTVLLEKGYIPTPYLGLGLQPVRVPESLKQKLNLTQQGGALVVHVESGSPAEKAGFLLGDVVLKIAGSALGEERTMSILSRLSPGEKAEVAGIRGGQLFSATMKVGERPRR